MKLFPTQTDEASLLHLGREAVTLLEKRDFRSLADRFGYALACGTTPATAIENDLRSCIAELRALSERQTPDRPSLTVKYFKPNASGLFALVECVFITAEECSILAELIVTYSGMDKYISLEQVSLTTG